MRPSRSIRRLGAPLALLIVVALGPGTVLAHAELDTVLPADTSTVAGSPVQVQMTFTEALDPAKSSITLVDAAGAVVAAGSTVDAGNPTTMRLVLADELAPGTYTARWVSASAEDGDLDRGTTSFTVTAAASAAPSVAPSASAQASAAPSVSASAVIPSASPSAAPTTPASSTSDALVPIVVALIVLAGLGLWLLRGRSRSAR